MRVIGGIAKGRQLAGPRAMGTRPTSDLVREALFDVIGPGIAGARFLDLYAGTGAVGVEALSRGATAAVFVEKSKLQVDVIRDNLTRTGLGQSAHLLATDVMRGAATLAAQGDTFEYVFMDPPYASRDLPQVMAAVAPLVSVGGWMIVEHAQRTEVPNLPGFVLKRRLRYGDTGITIMERHREADHS